MVSATTYRALVVDDEAIVRQATMRALAKEGFVCQPAADGKEAITLFRESRFDAVVTDLRMPNANGHNLAVELLGLPDRPVVVVLTGVDEPRLVKDLTIRGVDEIQLKPVDYPTFAKGLKSLVDVRARHREAAARIAAAASIAEVQVDSPIPPNPLRSDKISGQQVTAIRNGLPSVPPTFDAYRKASADKFSAVELAEAVREDPTLSVEVVQLGNSMAYAGQAKIEQLERELRDITQRQDSAPKTLVAVATFAAGTILGWLLCWMS